MRHIKMLSMATVAAIAAMAIVGAASASAGTIHSCAGSGTTKSPCGAGLAPFSGKRTLHLLGLFTFSTGLLNVQCKKAERKDEITNSGTTTENAQGKVTEMSWSECSSAGCGEATVAPLGLGSFEATSTKTEVIKGAGAKFTTCGVTCEYKAAEATVTIKGGEEATATLSEVPLEKVGGSFLCSSTATWSGHLDLLPQHFGYSVLI
jgi:hypothetical protein